MQVQVDPPPVAEVPPVSDKYVRSPDPTSGPQQEGSTDDTTYNGVIILRSFETTNQIQGVPGKLYYDKANKKVKIYIDQVSGWADLQFTSTSTSSTSTSTSTTTTVSTSTSTTSTSTSTTHT
jgi:hypothetical protein